jgi:hypothetical protein
MGKIIGVLGTVVIVWGALAQIMPEHFQIRGERMAKFKPYVFGEKSIWIAVIVAGCLFGWYTWNLEGRIGSLAVAINRQPVSANAAVEVDGPIDIAGWTADTEKCQAIVDASALSTKTRSAFEIALICGMIDPTIDRQKDTRITSSRLFSWQPALQIVAPLSPIMKEGLGKMIQAEADRARPNCGSGQQILIHAHFWMDVVLLPKGFDISNIHSLSDVALGGGRTGERRAEVEVQQMMPCSATKPRI